MIDDYANNFVAFILTHGRPDNVKTYTTLRRLGYTGRIILLVDDLDKTQKQYIDKYGDEVFIFDKKAISKTFDTGDNFDDIRTIVYARNACFGIAKEIGVKYFIQLDDDYRDFDWRFNDKKRYCHKKLTTTLDYIFSSLLRFFISSNISTIALAQGGDFIGGAGSGICFGDGIVGLKRKAMNSFICSTDREFSFLGRINEDVNTYTRQASTGLLMFTSAQASLEQATTQTSDGGMTDVYIDSGTYLKSFYSVMYHPSSVKIRMMGAKNSRLHHSVRWNNTTPMILNESVKKFKKNG